MSLYLTMLAAEGRSKFEEGVNLQIRRDKATGAPVALCKDVEAVGEQDDDAHEERGRRGVHCNRIILLVPSCICNPV